jgi:hypothetical protein
MFHYAPRKGYGYRISNLQRKVHHYYDNFHKQILPEPETRKYNINVKFNFEMWQWGMGADRRDVWRLEEA